MTDFIISDDIYQDSLSLTETSYQISDDLFREVAALNDEIIKAEICNSYKFSGRYWIWRLGTYESFLKGMFTKGEMWINAFGFKYLLSYPTLTAMAEEYTRLHPRKEVAEAVISAYYTFANRLHSGDVIIVYNLNTILGWGVIESNYIYRPSRKLGRHYRKVSWHEIKMPLIFSPNSSIIYQLPKAQNHLLKETLIDKAISNIQSLPLPFENSK